MAQRIPDAVEISLVDPRDDDAVDAVQSYFAELDRRFPSGFDPAGVIEGDAPRMRPPTGAFLVARSGDVVAACGGVQRFGDGAAEIKRMWVHPDHRGRGLGTRLLRALEDQAIDLGYTTVVLDTNTELTEAMAMYASAGYLAIDRYNDNPYAGAWFEKRLVDPDQNADS